MPTVSGGGADPIPTPWAAPRPPADATMPEPDVAFPLVLLPEDAAAPPAKPPPIPDAAISPAETKIRKLIFRSEKTALNVGKTGQW